MAPSEIQAGARLDMEACLLADQKGINSRVLTLEPQNSRDGPPPRLCFANFLEPERGTRKLDVSEVEREFLSLSEKDSNGFSGSRTTSGTAFQIKHDSWWSFKVKVAEHDPQSGQSRIKSRWLQPSVYISWNSNDKVTLILGIDTPPAVQEVVKEAFKSGRIDTESPYSWHEFLIRTFAELYDFSFWKLRDLVREHVEKNRSTDATKFEMLHEVARQVILSNETLDVALRTIGAVQRSHQGFCRTVNKISPVNSSVQEGQLDIELALAVLQDLLYAKLARCGALRDRISNEINLAFNLCSQSEAFMTKTIAVITLTFLPGSLVAAILGMNVFDFSESSKDVKTSPKIWIFFVVSFVLTVVTFGIWLFLLRGTKKLTPLSEEIRSTRERGIERQSTLLKRLNKSKTEIMTSRV
ncbi:uncharacterized protein J3D65DRAFT_611936 [Phyllosticta citribraziliensis]|uniref:Uncharacterized protein n=1 Tax=Phyllosticta citribraziliensis TaxID=989973 RepID=A0ABR1MBB6_9PEZI